MIAARIEEVQQKLGMIGGDVASQNIWRNETNKN